MDEVIRVTREQIDAIGQDIADLSLRIDIAKHELLTQLRKFDKHDGWANSGFLSLAAWLAWRIDISPVAAREYVRVAQRGLPTCPYRPEGATVDSATICPSQRHPERNGSHRSPIAARAGGDRLGGYVRGAQRGSQ
jgi:hypothetical protein